LERSEYFFEMPLDSITGQKLSSDTTQHLPRWKTVKELDRATSAAYQQAAASIAKKMGLARVHLDAMWWGRRDSAAKL
jgi:hypothetical protein